MSEVVIGVDGGTTAVKAVAFSLDGAIVASHHEGVPVDYGSNGEAEQDMNAIWRAVATCLRSVSDQLGDATVLAVGLTGQGDGLWLVDADAEPARPAATWMDGRASARVQRWVGDGRADTMLEVTGTSVFGGKATIYGTVVGSIIIGIIEAGIIAAGLAGFWTRLVYGLIIIVSVSVHALVLKTKRE